MALSEKLSEQTGIPSDKLLEDFGKHMFGRLCSLYPDFFCGTGSAFDFLSHLEEHIHTEIRKIYPDCELAAFVPCQPDPQTLLLTYTSPRPFAAMALGLIKGCCCHFQEPIAITQEDLSTERVTRFRFTLKHF